jgi:exonuclease SbcC
MKPLKLVMTAFGPYKQKEVVNFQELGEHRLFSITGNTGAGKTTIFDAICFALYGEASGEERSDTSMLRSHFAADDVYTSVELTFELKGKVYRIFRQMGHKKAGNKTVTGGAVEFYVRNGEEEEPCVDRFHVTDVNRKIESLIGLTKNQFSQIVMLPQGEFRKLLTSETENKEEILRRIFKTDRYKWIQELLDQRRKALKAQLQDKLTERDIHFRNVLQLPIRSDSLLEQVAAQEKQNSYQILQALTEELAFYEAQLQEIESEIELQEQQLKEKTAAFHEAKAINERFAAFQEKLERKTELLHQQAGISQREQQIALADKANGIASAEGDYQKARQATAQKRQLVSHWEQKTEEIKMQFERIKQEYEAEKAKETEREQAKQHLRSLQELQSILENLQEKKQSILSLKTKVQQGEAEIQRLTESLEQSRTTRRALTATWEELEHAAQLYLEKNEQLNIMRQDAALLQEYCKNLEQAQQYSAQLQQQKEVFLRIQEKYKQLEQAWLEGQAGMLALHLQDGASCPVCGSTHHPAKAVQTHEVDKQELLDLKEKRDEAEREYYRTEEACKSRMQACKELEPQLQERGYSCVDVGVQKDRLIAQGKLLRAEVDQLKQKLDTKSAVQQQLQAAETEFERNQAKKEEVAHQLQSIQMQLVEQQLSYENDKKQIPKELSSLSAWQTACAAAERTLRALEQAWNTIQTRYQEIATDSVRAQTSYENALSQLKEATEEEQKARLRFHAELQKADFASKEDYQQAKMTTSEYQSSKQIVQQYYTALHAVEQQLEELRTALQGKQMIDLQVLQEEIDRIDIELEVKKEQRQKIKSGIDRMTELQQNITKIDELIQEEERKYEQLVDLYEVIKGDNDSRISFERYILIEYLEQIVQAANERLRKLSNGQFYLKRSERVEKRNRQSGLGLDVYDVYTGQTRDVKTLSGGEKFNASLCLALGMADVIQAYEGGVSIETMFIDEGFGSLDEESLMKAIDTLIDLQKSGRLIGVISHVQELKNAMPAVLEVTKQKDGCSKTRFVIK